MKILSIGIPCYNSMEYMDKAIESLLVCKEDVEIIIVNDGSKDKTDEIGKMYQEKYPETVKYVYQENGGHGEAVNTGLRNATGLYYKVLDSDDWFDSNAFVRVVKKLKELNKNNANVDMFIVNYVYEKPSENKVKPINYTNAFPTDRIFTWADVKYFLPQQNLLMHSMIYRTQLLRDCKLELPKHTFYVDNLFAYQPLPYVKKMYYMNVNLYRYFIGRGDQSVNEKIMISRIDQQLRVNRLMVDYYNSERIKEKKLDDYMVKYVTMITAVSTVLAIRSKTQENLDKKNELFYYIKSTNPALYKKMKKTLIGSCIEWDNNIGRKTITAVYSIARKIFPVN